MGLGSARGGRDRNDESGTSPGGDRGGGGGGGEHGDTTPRGDFSRFGGFQDTDSEAGFGGLNLGGEGGGLSNIAQGVLSPQQFAAQFPGQLPAQGQVDVRQYIENIRNINPIYDQAQRVQNVGTTEIPFQGPEAPFDFSSPAGLAEFGLSLFGGGVSGGLKTFGETLKFNADRAQALETKIMNDFGVPQEEAQQFIRDNGLTINQIFGGDTGQAGEGGGLGLGNDGIGEHGSQLANIAINQPAPQTQQPAPEQQAQQPIAAPPELTQPQFSFNVEKRNPLQELALSGFK